MDAQMTTPLGPYTAWIVLSYSLSQENGGSLRVSLWRRLRRIGAFSPKGGLHILPSSDENVEAFDWIAQEAKHAGGDAFVMHVERFEGLPNETLIEAFNQMRAEAYAALESEIAALENDVQALSTNPAEYRVLYEPLMRLRRRREDIAEIDFFTCDEGQRVASRLEILHARLRAPKTEDVMSAPRQDYIGRTWVTRPRPFIDRLACIWLIRRYIDEEAHIRYDTAGTKDEITFDMPDATFGHRGSDCSFETMLKAFGVSEPPVLRIAQIVHAIDLKDDRADVPEAFGVEMVLRGWQRSDLTDEQLEERGISLFDGLLENFRNSTVLPKEKGRP